MTDNTEHPLDYLAELALGGLPAGDASDVEAHLIGCADCASEFSKMQRVAQLLPLAVEDLAPRPAVKFGLLERIAAEPRPIGARSPGRPRWHWIMAVAAAAAVLLVSGGVLGASLFGKTGVNSDASREKSLVQAFAQGTATTSRGEQGGATVTLLSAPGERDAFAWVANLPALPTGKDYQAWFIRDGQAEPSTAFHSGAGGVWIVAGDMVDRFGTMALTIEDSGGAKAPSGKPFVAVELQKRVQSGRN